MENKPRQEHSPDLENRNKERIEERTAELMPTMVSEVMAAVKQKYDQVSPNTIAIVANSIRPYVKRGLLNRTSDLTAWGEQVINEYTASSGFGDRAYLRILRSIVSEFQKQLNFIIQEEELRPLGQYLKNYNLHEVNLLQLQKINPAWSRLANWYLSKAGGVNILKGRFNWDFTLKRPKTEDIVLPELGDESEIPEHNVSEEEHGFGSIASNPPHRTPNLDEQEGGSRDY